MLINSNFNTMNSLNSWTGTNPGSLDLPYALLHFSDIQGGSSKPAAAALVTTLVWTIFSTVTEG